MSHLVLLLLLQASASPATLPDTPVQPIAETLMLRHTDYPQESLRNDERGDVRLLLEISAEGRVTACTIQHSTATPRLEAQSCNLALTRFRFRPATKAGVPAATRAILPLQWRVDDMVSSPPPR